MKRDLELMRKIMLWCEEQPHASIMQLPSVDGYTEEEIGYHVYLLYDAGLIDAIDVTAMDNPSPYWWPKHITAAGHDFISAARDDTLWAKAREKVIKPAGGVALQTLIEWLKIEVKSRLGLPP